MKPVSFILSQLEAAMSILNARHILLLKKCFQEGINRNKKKRFHHYRNTSFLKMSTLNIHSVIRYVIKSQTEIALLLL